MDKIEELLPNLDNFLRNVLAKEKLSILAEKRRKYYVERLDIVKFSAPNPPPKPEAGLMKMPPGSVIQTVPVRTTITAKQINGHMTHQTQDIVEENIYDGIEIEDMDNSGYTTGVLPTSDDLYLMPESIKSGSSVTTDTRAWSDAESGTSYESYDDDDPDNNYANIDTPTHDVPLPRKAKKKKKKSTEPELRVNELENILFRGEIYHKGSWKWDKRYCVISDNRLLVYKTEKSARPFINFVLLGYQIAYLEKEGRRNHVLRVSHPNCESQFFSADLKEIADLWLDYLKTAAGDEQSSSGDSIGFLFDSMSTGGSVVPDQHSTSTGSEGGSGDGVVTAQHKSPKSSDNKGQSEKEKKKKNILTDFLGTFNKKKGQKVIKRVIDISDITVDPQARMAGILDISNDTMAKNTWSTRYCCVKDGRFECYHEKASDGIELSLPLFGADIQNAGKETKRDLAYKLLWDNGDSIVIDCLDTIEQGKWLHALIMEREGIRDTGESSGMYENQEMIAQLLAAPPSGGEGEMSIYDEVYDVQITTGKGDKLDGDTARALSQLKNLNISSGRLSRTTSSASDSGITLGRSSSTAADRVSKHVVRTSSTASDSMVTVGRSASNVSDRSDGSGSAPPPPLPSTDPPKRPLLVKKRRSQIDDEGYNDNKDIALSEEMASAYTNIKSRLDDSSSPSRSRRTDSSKTKQDTAGKTDDNGVIKCHLGPTIAEDKELLESTQNSILSCLRDEKRKGSIDPEILTQQIDDIKKKILTLRKQKSELRGKILTSRGSREKQRLESELNNMDQMLETASHEVTKLQLLAEQKCVNLSRNSSFSSPSSSRNNSLRRDVDRPTTLKTLTKTTPDKRTSPRDTKTSPRGTKSTPLHDRNNFRETKTSPKSKHDTRVNGKTSPGAGKISPGSSMSKSWAKPTPSSSATTRQALAKFETNSDSKSSPNKKLNITSTKLEPLKVGTTRIRTVHTTTSVRSASPQGPNVAGQKSNGQMSKLKDGEKAKPRKVVKEQLKMWEALSGDASC